LLAYAKEIEPLIHELTLLEHEVDRATLSFQIFSAEDTLIQAEEKCKQVKEKLDKINISSKYKTTSIDRMNTLCKAMRGHVKNLLALGYDKKALSIESIKNQRALAADKCKKKEMGLNCTIVDYLSQFEDLRDLLAAYARIQGMKELNPRKLRDLGYRPDLPDSLKDIFIESIFQGLWQREGLNQAQTQIKALFAAS
jgi:chromosome segregation ATPase